MTKIKIALIQLNTGENVEKNLEDFRHFSYEASRRDVDLIVTPEVVNCITSDHKQRIKSSSTEQVERFLSVAKKISRESQTYFLIGSLARREINSEKCENRSYLINRIGNIVAHYDKIHMFDVKLSESERYKESDFYRPGGEKKMYPCDFGKLGMTICYDLRFPKLFSDLALSGAEIITVPSAFTQNTGTRHWEVLLRARAIETGAFIVAPAQTGEHGSTGRKSYGHSMIVSPDGEILLQLKKLTGVGVTEIDLKECGEARRNIPNLINQIHYK